MCPTAKRRQDTTEQPPHYPTTIFLPKLDSLRSPISIYTAPFKHPTAWLVSLFLQDQLLYVTFRHILGSPLFWLTSPYHLNVFLLTLTTTAHSLPFQSCHTVLYVCLFPTVISEYSTRCAQITNFSGTYSRLFCLVLLPHFTALYQGRQHFRMTAISLICL